MNYGELLLVGTKTLEKSGIVSARLDTILILEHCLGLDRTYMLAHPENMATETALENFQNILAKRTSGVPMAYILGKKEFYGRVFEVTPDVLIPRPDSEIIINMLKKYAEPCKDNPCCRDYPCKLLDVGTGSGCLAITAKLELPAIDVTACDISKNVLKVAKHNARKLGANVKFVHSDLLNNIGDKFDIVLANLPYVPVDYNVSSDVKHEPDLALYAGVDGLDIIKELFVQLPTKVNQSAIVIVESLISQHDAIKNIAQEHDFGLIKTKDLIQVFKSVAQTV